MKILVGYICSYYCFQGLPVANILQNIFFCVRQKNKLYIIEVLNYDLNAQEAIFDVLIDV